MPCLKTNLVSLEKILEITGRKINCLCFLQPEKKKEIECTNFNQSSSRPLHMMLEIQVQAQKKSAGHE
jgi:hypothetical protein